MTRRLRLFAVGGFLSYRALFGWLNPYLFVIILLVPSGDADPLLRVPQRAADVEDDSFYVVGNAIVACNGAALLDGRHGSPTSVTRTPLSLLVVSPRAVSRCSSKRALRGRQRRRGGGVRVRGGLAH